MHKIKLIPKFQNPWATINLNNVDFEALMKNYQVGGSTDIKEGFNLKNFLGNEKNQQMLSSAPDVVETGMKLLGGKEATLQGAGDQILKEGSNMLWKGALKTGNPYAIAGAAVIKGVDYLNRYAGKNTKKQKTLGIDTGGYDLATSVNAGQKTTLFGMGKAKYINKQTKSADRSNILAGQAAYESKMDNTLAQSNFSDILSKNNKALLGGTSTNILSAKKGAAISPGSLKSLSEKVVRNMRAKETDKNVIPSGALHSRLNHIEGFEDQITPKGIPVITYEEGDKIVQHAEVESAEIIFRKEISEKLESMLKEYEEADEEKKKQLEIECGKLLAEEIIENTIDNVGLLQ